MDGFDWDDGNEFKNERKHGITRDVVEAFFTGGFRVAPDLRHSSTEDRFLAIGKPHAPGKPMVVAFTFRRKDGKNLLRPISARYMHAKEIRKYEQTFAQDEK